jgi:hypothetical protein
MRKLYKIKQTYSIEEVAERLSLTLGEPVGESEVLRLMADSELGIFWRLHHVCLRPYRDDGMDETWDRSGIFRVSTELDADAKLWAQRLAAGIEDDDYIRYEGTVLVDSEGIEWELMQLTRDKSSLIWDRRYPKRQEIIVTKSELDRFESQFSANDASAAKDETADVSSRSRDTFQKQIAALALALAAKHSKYKRGEAPNANQIAAAIDEILGELPDANTHGLSSATIRANIKAGIDLLNG